ncbi:MAG TPA: monovalent cation/H+ antiporter complex subunit F [Candidatus Krumholzibacteria bacterium]|nr:monovalent cation/H+ antiporter complex subunit F [Candidatus Krumholzibacteria bacterium]
MYGRIDMFVDIAIAYAMLNFSGGLVMAKYLDTTGGEPR